MPYIPKEHEKYGLLPFCCENEGEVISYSSRLESKTCELLPEGHHVIPYSYDSCESSYDER